MNAQEIESIVEDVKSKFIKTLNLKDVFKEYSETYPLLSENKFHELCPFDVYMTPECSEWTILIDTYYRELEKVGLTLQKLELSK